MHHRLLQNFLPCHAGQDNEVHDEALKMDTLPELAANNFVSTEPAPVSNPYEALEGAADTTGADVSAQ